MGYDLRSLLSGSALLAFAVAGTHVEAALNLTVQSPPSSLSPNQIVNINVNFSKTPDEAEKRIVIRVDLYDADSHVKVAGGIADNSGIGYTASSGIIPCNVTVPSNASGGYYFKATASPWSLNRAVVTRYKSYPTDGTFSYYWDSSRSGDYGVTQDVTYMGSVICPDYAGNTTYCSGVAFETCVLAYNAYNTTYGHARIGNILSATNMRSFRTRWYGVTDAEKLAARAIPEWGVGREITDWEEAQEGDSIQLWRHSGSGHNPLFVNWVRNASNQITGVRYWGSQGSGISYRTESFGATSGLNPARFYIGRVAKPRDQADYDWALGQNDTRSTPSFINSGINTWSLY